MAFHPYPNRVRALRQIERHAHERKSISLAPHPLTEAQARALREFPEFLAHTMQLCRDAADEVGAALGRKLAALTAT